jgi:hypothetical protein
LEMPLLKWWAVANASAIALGLCALFGFHTIEGDRGTAKTRTAIVLWAIMVLSCVALASLLD